MFESLFADGLVSGVSDKIAAFVVKCLAVGGGFLVGYFLGGVIAWALDRWVFAQKAPASVKKAVSWVAAIALALLVALIVFGEGGNGLFGGGGKGEGAQTQDENGKAKTPAAEPKKEEITPKKDETPKQPPPKPTPGDVHVTILGGNEVKDGRLYVIDDNPTPKNFEEFKQAILERQKNTKAPLMIIFRFDEKNPLSDKNPNVRRAVDWVNQQKLANRFE